MQLSDLMQLFREGQNEGRKRGYVMQGACDAEGIRAVIAAISVEVAKRGEPAQVDKLFDEILCPAAIMEAAQ